MITFYTFEESKRLGITKEIINDWINQSNIILPQDHQSEILAGFMIGENSLAVEKTER